MFVPVDRLKVTFYIGYLSFYPGGACNILSFS